MLQTQRHNHTARARVLASLVSLLSVIGAVSCTASHSWIQTEPVGPLTPDLPRSPRDGELVVYSARHSSTVGQSEYPQHTDYGIRGPGADAFHPVANQAGLFAQDPAPLKLVPGEYRVKALVEGGGYVVVPVIIEAGKRTVVDLVGTVMPQNPASDSHWVKLRDGQVVGWQARSGLNTGPGR